MAAVITLPDFRLLWIGQGTSFLDDQFAMIALPWLVLALTGDPLALGMILACLGIPRAISMIFGGAVSDHFSARVVMLASDLARLVLMIGLVFLVMSGVIRLWMIFVFAVAFGAASGFFMPASNAIVPTLVSRDNLAAGNAIFQSTIQLSQFIGPAITGSMIAWFAHNQSQNAAQAGPQGLAGISVAFGIDGMALLVSVITLWLMHTTKPEADSAPARMLEAIRSGVRFLGATASCA